MDEDTRLHLQMIQGVIGRMASNSFALKGWSVTVSAALLGLAAKDAETSFALLALYPALSFWALDAYYLRQERLFRELFKSVAQGGAPSNFSMDTTPFEDQVEKLSSVATSDTVAGLHLPVLVAVVAVLTFTICR